MSTTIKSSYLLRVLKGDYNPFTPNVIKIDDQFIEYRKRNWYLISVDTKSFHLDSIIGVEIDKHLIGATLRIVTSGHSDIVIKGFTKTNAEKIKKMYREYISY